MIDTQKLLNELKQFTGADYFFSNPLFPKYVYTEGVKYLAENANCYWLIDYVFSNQLLSIISKEPFQTWKITTDDSQATIVVEDGNDNIIQQFKLEYTDFPLKEFTLWFVDGTLLLPSEY